jgi:hypothetical protein
LLEEELFLIRGEGPIINSPTSLINGIEHTLERHELRLLAVGPLPPIDEDSGEEESIEGAKMCEAEGPLKEMISKITDNSLQCSCS